MEGTKLLTGCKQRGRVWGQRCGVWVHALCACVSVCMPVCVCDVEGALHSPALAPNTSESLGTACFHMVLPEHKWAHFTKFLIFRSSSSLPCLLSRCSSPANGPERFSTPNNPHCTDGYNEAPEGAVA